MISPFVQPPHPLAQEAAREVINKVHAYMRAHPESELHKQGKMFGVLVYSSELPHNSSYQYIAAFSAQLDGSYYHDGFIPPVYDMPHPPVGNTKEESRRLQRLLFANYSFINGKGESKSLLDIFSAEKPIIPADEWFTRNREKYNRNSENLPPAGTGECCAPKLLQYALTHNLQPFALAEFWIGAATETEIRHEGVFYTPCSGKCVPILRHMLQGLEIAPTQQALHTESLCRQIETIYEDDWLLVVNKPAGLLSVPGKTAEISITEYLSQCRNITIQATHRLDQDTSGLLVMAKHLEIYKSLQSYFQRRDILKRYEAVIRPAHNQQLIAQEGIISLPLLPNPYDRPRQMVDREHGKTAITRYIIREHRTDGSIFVDFYPQTGRTHQLRVHAAHPEGLNAPIIGDRLYGAPDIRLYLHAAEINFLHPISKEEMHFCIPSGF